MKIGKTVSDNMTALKLSRDLWNAARALDHHRRVDLSYAGLSARNLSGYDLSNVNLNDANLSGCDLRAVDLSDSSLIGADLSCSDLRQVNMSGARCEQSLDLLNACDVKLAGALVWPDARPYFYADGKTALGWVIWESMRYKGRGSSGS